MNDYVKVDVNKYVRKGLENGSLIPFKAEKFARIIAEQGIVGEEVISWSTDKDGKPIKEKVDSIKIDEKTNNPGWIATKANEQGDPIIDGNGKLNQWIIQDSVFKAKYEPDSENHGLYKPAGGTQIFVRIPDNIILNQWGQEMKIAEGGYINITNVDDMYGISKRDFEDTYRPINTEEKRFKI